jgi:enoyl-[acyl-carrier protein] reductase II
MQKNPKIRDQCVYGVTSAGTPREAAEFWKKKNLSLKHFHVAPALWLAEKVVATKCDGIVMTGYEGGGHQSYEGITTVILVQQAVKEFPQIPLVACGGFATPQGVAMAIAAGADAVAMGTRFIATKQSEFHENYKAKIYPANAEDTIMTTGAFGPIRLLKNKYALEHGKIMTKEEKKAQEATVVTDLAALDKEMERYELVYKGDVENGAVLLGQTVGLIDTELNVDDIVSGFSKKAEEILKNAVSKIH